MWPAVSIYENCQNTIESGPVVRFLDFCLIYIVTEACEQKAQALDYCIFLVSDSFFFFFFFCKSWNSMMSLRKDTLYMVMHVANQKWLGLKEGWP